MAEYEIGGEVFSVPDNVQGDELKRVLRGIVTQQKAAAAKQAQAEDVSRAQAVMIGIGSGFARAGYGVKGLIGALDKLITGDADMLNEAMRMSAQNRELMAPLKQRLPFTTGGGEIVGEIAGTAPFGVAAGRAATAGATRAGLGGTAAGMAGAGATGAAEGAIIGAADQQAGTGALIGGAVGLGVQASFPMLSRVFGKVYGRPMQEADLLDVGRIRDDLQFRMRSPYAPDMSSRPQPGQIPTEELAAALDDISRMGEIPLGANAQQLERIAAFSREGIPMAGRSRVTQKTEDFAREIQLNRQRDNAAADQLRQQYWNENTALVNRSREIAGNFGVGEEVGEKVQYALGQLRKNLNSAKRNAYLELRDEIANNPEIAELIPLPSATLRETIESVQERIVANETQQGALDKVMAQFGLIGDSVKVGPRNTKVAFLDDDGNVIDTITYRGKPKTLNLGTMEDFRQRINLIFDPADPRQAAARREIMGLIDDEVDLMVETIPEAMPQNITEKARRARTLAREEKVVLNPKRIIDKLSKANADGALLMDASKVYENIRRSTPEDYSRLISGLRSGVDGGEDAVAALKSATLMDFTEQALKTATKITDDAGASSRVFSGTNFTKAINKFGRQKAKNLFGEDWPTIMRLEKIGESRIAPDTAVQKGSAPDLINNIMNSISRLSQTVPGVGPVAIGAASMISRPLAAGVERVRARGEVQQAINLAPDRDQIMDFSAVYFPKTFELLQLAAPPAVTSQMTEKER